MIERITVTEMVKSMSDVINKVYYRGDSFDIIKGKTIVAKLSPVNVKKTLTIGELQTVLQNMPRVDPEFAKDLKGIDQSIVDGIDSWD